jgi:prevent-host-death family protein
MKNRKAETSSTAGRTRPNATYIPATHAKNSFARLLEEVVQGREVIITKHNEPRAAVISMDKLQAMETAAIPSLEALTADYEARLARMQSARARAAMERAFAASSDNLGEAAVHAARSRS